MSKTKEEKYLYILPHMRIQIQEFSIFAEQLKKEYSIPSVCLVKGTKNLLDAQKIAKYDKVVDLIRDFRPSDAKLNFQENKNKLAKWEKEWGGFHFFRQVAQDRRLFRDAMHGRRRRWSLSDELIAEYAVHIKEKFDSLFSKCPPLAVIGETTCLPSNILYYMCQREDAPYLSLFTARHFDNRFYFADDLYSSWFRFQQLYKQYLNKGIPPELESIARKKYAIITEKQYHPAQRFKDKTRGPVPLFTQYPISRFYRLWQYVRYDLFKDGLKNPVIRSPLTFNPLYFVLTFLKKKIRQYYFDNLYSAKIKLVPCFACYFLHSQPEYSIRRLGFEYQNQIELVKNIATILPANMLLYVKEHPVMIGRRPIAYYKKLGQIPNVEVLNDKVDSHQLIKQAKLVFTIAGTAALEAVFHQTPAVVFGDVFYNKIKGVHHIRSLRYDLKSTVGDILENPEKFTASKKDALAVLAAMYKASYKVLYPPHPASTLGMDKVGSPKNRELLGNALIKELKKRGKL